MIACLNNATIGADTLEGFLEAAAAAGFGAVEVGVGSLEDYVERDSLEGLRAELARKNLLLGSGGLPVNWQGTDEQFAADLDGLQRRLRLCRELGLSRLCTWIPPRWDKPYLEVLGFARERLGATADVLRDYDARLGLEFVAPQGGFLQRRYKFITTLAELLHLIQVMGRDNVGVMLDSYHLYVGETPFAEIAALPEEMILQFHINDAYPGVPRPNLEDHRRLLPGEGTIPLVPMLRALRSTGYDWTVSVETFNEEVKSLGPVEAAKRTKAALDSILGALG